MYPPFCDAMTRIIFVNKHGATILWASCFCIPKRSAMSRDDNLAHILQVVNESATGSTTSKRVRLSLTIAVERVDFDSNSCLLRLSGRNSEENPHVKVRCGRHGRCRAAGQTGGISVDPTPRRQPTSGSGFVSCLVRNAVRNHHHRIAGPVGCPHNTASTTTVVMVRWPCMQPRTHVSCITSCSVVFRGVVRTRAFVF